MRPFSQVDVFTSAPLRGNPLAVVHDAEGLTDDADGARSPDWTNLSETTFLLPPTDPGADYRVRIWTPGPASCRSPGTRRSAARTPGWRPAVRRSAADRVVQECGAGLVRLRRGRAARVRRAAADPLGPGRRGRPLADRARPAGARQLTSSTPPGSTTGPGWIGVAAPRRRGRPRPRAGLRAAIGRPRHRRGRALRPSPGRRRRRGARLRPGYGIGEDPVTGCLNAAFGQWLTGNGALPRRTSRPRGHAWGGRDACSSSATATRSGWAATRSPAIRGEVLI